MDKSQFLITHRTLRSYARYYRRHKHTRILLKFAILALRAIYENTEPPTEKDLDDALILSSSRRR